MTLELFDVQAGFGGVAASRREIPTAQQLLAEMDRLDIAGALVRTVPDDLDRDVVASNRILLEACAANPRLRPCPVVVPNSGHDLAPEDEQVDAAIRQGAPAVVIRPAKDSWILADWVAGPLLGALERRRMPVVCLVRHTAYTDVADIARRHPALPLILAEVDYASFRVQAALLEAFPNVYLSIGSNFTIHQGVEQFTARVGAERLLFGTGHPETICMPAVTLLTYADISHEQRQLIGSGNFRRLMGGVRK